MKSSLRAPLTALLLGLSALASGGARADEAALKAAVETRNHAALGRLLEAGERPEPLPAKADQLRTAAHPLALAVANKDLQAAELLLRSGLPTEDLRQIGGLIDRQPAMLALFLNQGLDPEARFMGVSLMAFAVLEGDAETLALLVNKGARLDGRDAEGNSLLHLAQRSIRKRRLALVETLLARGQSVRAINQAGDTPLHLAFEDADPATIERLLGAGAALDTRNKLGLSPLAYLWGSSRNHALQARHPATALNAAEREFAVLRLIDGGDDCRALPPLVAAAGASPPEAWVARAVRRNNPACLQRLLALGASPNVSEEGQPLWLRESGEAGEAPKLVARQLIATGARLSAGPVPRMALLAPLLAEPAHRDWWRLAGFTLKTPLQLHSDSPPITVEAWLKRTAPKTLAAWKQPNPLKPRALHGPGWTAALPELTGVWQQQPEGRSGPEPEAANEWQFAADGRFAARLRAMFLKLEPQGRWRAEDGLLQLQGENDPSFQRPLTPLLWVGDEIWFDEPLGVQRFKRVAAQVRMPPAAPRDAAGQCAAATRSLQAAAPQLRSLSEQTPADASRQAQLQALASRLGDQEGFQRACLGAYAQDPRMQQLADCLGQVEGLLGVLACVGRASGEAR